MIHMLRQIINDDIAFRDLLRRINSTFYHQTLTSQQLENYIMQETSLELHGFFDQYLRTITIPAIELKSKNGLLKYRYKNTVKNFSIPVKFYCDGEEIWLTPSTEWQDYNLPSKQSDIRLDPNFYMDIIEK